MQELQHYGPYVALAISAAWAWWGYRLRNRGGTTAAAKMEFQDIDDMVQSYTQSLMDMSVRITKQEHLIINIRVELQQLMAENEQLREQIRSLEQENSELRGHTSTN